MDTLQNLQADFLHTDTLHLTVRCNPSRAEAALKKIAAIQKITATANGSLTELIIECKKGEDIREQVFFAFSEIRCPIIAMNLHEASLEEVFLSATLPEQNASKPLKKAPVGRVHKAAETPLSPIPQSHPSKPSATVEDTDEDEDEDDYKPLFGRKEKDHK